MSNGYAWIPCTIRNSGFSHERQFRVNVGNAESRGVASLQYLRDSDRREVQTTSPFGGGEGDGFVMCRILRRHPEGLAVNLPNSETICVPEDVLQPT
jgi:hypothetical protein